MKKTFEQKSPKATVKYKKIGKSSYNIINNIKKAAAVFLSAALMLPSAAYAEVLGTPRSARTTQLAQGTVLHTNVFNSPSVGNQTEHYVEYTPNPDVMPALTNGWSVYGKRTLTKADSILRELGYNPAMGMNADFFSFQTGVPMSNTVIDGRVWTKDSSWQWGIGFKSDGTAFCAKFPVTTTITTADGSYFSVECINKYRQPYALYLYTDDFADNTHSPDWGRDVVLGSVSGDIRIGSNITAVVEDISDHDGSVPIPDGKLVLSVSAAAAQEIKDRLALLEVGQTVTISTNAALEPELWNSAVYATGCTGGKLLTNGQLDLEDESAAPRSAVGIKPDGTIIFYTIDGRQSGYSYGARKETVARRLLELGCTEAVNLDGGGSTSMGAVMPGTTNLKIVNSPSDNGLRSCANFLFLLKLIEPTGIPYALILNNYGAKLLSGAAIDVSVVSAYDTSYGPATIPDGIEYYIEDDADTADGTGVGSSVNSNGYLTVRGNGDVFVAAKAGDAAGSTMVSSVTTPDSIEIYSADNGYPINELIMEPGSSVSLTAKSKWYGEELVSDSSCYRWTVVSNGDSVGEIELNGVFHASDTSGATGTLAVSAGVRSVEIPIIISSGGSNPVYDEYPTIDASVRSGALTAVISGGVKKENASVTVDGMQLEFEFDESEGRLSCDIGSDGAYHRVGIFVTADSGASSMAFLDSGDITKLENKFSDTSGHWASAYISYLSRCGVLNGSLEDDNKILFRPASNMTRTEFAVMLCNYLGVNTDDYAQVTLPFNDCGDIPWWAEKYVKTIYALGIMQGQLGEYGVAFNPNANINRMEFAISLTRLLPKGLSAEPVSAADADDIPFWAEDGMRTVCTQGIMTGYPDGTLLPLNNVTRAEAAKMLYNVFGA